MIIETRSAPPFFKNGFVLGCEDTRQGVVIDPGDEVEALIAAVAQHGLTIRYILLTHAHLDHITGVAPRRRRRSTPRWGSTGRTTSCTRRSCSRARCSDCRSGRSPRSIFSTRFRALTVSGTSVPGCITRPGIAPVVCASRSDAMAKRSVSCLSGIRLFAGSIGRTDLPGGDHETLLRSIRDVLFTFPDDTVVFPGHGDPTTIGAEKRTNPFLTDASARHERARPGRLPACRPPSTAPRHPLAVDEGAVRALQIHDLELGRPGGELAVEPRHQRRVDNELGPRRAADCLDAARQDAESERGLGASSAVFRIHMRSELTDTRMDDFARRASAASRA